MSTGLSVRNRLILVVSAVGLVMPPTVSASAPPALAVSDRDAPTETAVARFFPVAVWYSGGKARAPMLEAITPESRQLWKQDLVKIKQLGFNAVRTWVEWNTGEPREGEYHLENLDLLLELAGEVGLRVIVQVYVDSAPEWIGIKYPDGHYAAQDGQPIPSQAAPGYCFDHRGVRQAVLNFLQEVARHAARSAAFFAWDLWSEPAALNWARIGYKSQPMFCYCPSSRERFRQWLKAKYGSLPELNQAWHRSFNDWNQVDPPRYGTILTYTDFMDWRMYYGDKLSEDLKMRHAAVKAIDPDHITSSHAPNPSPLVRTLADPYDPTDDFQMKDSVDYFGTSFYPKLTSVERNWTLERQALAMDLTSAITAGRGFYVGELQSGYGVHGTIVGSPVTANDLQLWGWGLVARGARSISFYAFYPMNAGYESGGYGLIDLDGSLTARSRAAGQMASAVAANSDLLLHSHPEAAEAAIVFSPLAPLVGGYDEEGGRNAIHEALAGYHRMFFERNLRLDVLSSRELEKSNLARYKLVIVPYPLMLTAEEAAALRGYVSAGGHLLVEARPGWVDERGHAQSKVPGFGWDEVFGVQEKQLIPDKSFEVAWGGSRFKAMTLREKFEVRSKGARVVARTADGTAVAYENGYGKGTAIILGGFAGQENYQRPVTMHPLGSILAQWAKIQPPRLRAAAKLELREMYAPQGRLVFFLNHGERPTTVEFERQLEQPARAIREILSGRKIASHGRTLLLQAKVPARGVEVYRIDF